jgi:hypothetical protein
MIDVQDEVQVEFAPLETLKHEVDRTRLSRNARARWQPYLDALRAGQQEALRITLKDNTRKQRLLLRRSIQAVARDLQFPVTIRATKTGLGVWPQSPEEAAEARQRSATMKAGRDSRKTIAQAIAAQPPVVTDVPSEVVAARPSRRRR